MKTNYSQASQITRTAETAECSWRYKGTQTAAAQPCLRHLCNLPNLRVQPVEGEL